jgi:hypothetical protein
VHTPDGDTLELTVSKFNLNNWYWDDWESEKRVNSTIRSETLQWRDRAAFNAVVLIESAPASVKMTKVTADSWGGALEATATAEKKGGGWSSHLVGGLQNIELDKLRDALGIEGVSFGAGDVRFDVHSDDAGFFSEPEAIEGQMNVSASFMDVPRFRPESLQEVLNQVTLTPENMPARFDKALKTEGNTTYTDIEGSFKLSAAKILIDKMRISGNAHTLNLGGVLDLAEDTYDLSADIFLSDTLKVDGVHISRSGPLQGALDYEVGVIAARHEEAPIEQEEIQEGQDNAIGGILQRLDESVPEGNVEDILPKEEGGETTAPDSNPEQTPE